MTEVTADGKIIPDVAESFESSPDAKQWVFRLRKGVEFHNGKSLDAADVIASFNYHRGPESKSAAKPLLADVGDIKADGKDTVIFTLANGNADFPYVAYDFHIPIMPAADGKVDWQSGIGTGPYTKASYEPGVRFEGKRFANYHRETYFDEIEVLSIVDVAARMNALISGEADFSDRADLKTLPMVNDAAKVLDDPSINVVIELIGGLEPARTFILKALASGSTLRIWLCNVAASQPTLMAGGGPPAFS